MTNEQRAEQLIKKYGFDFDNISKAEITGLIRDELDNYRHGSSEYLRALCGYLYCIGDKSDIPLLEKVKYGINMDVGCMIDIEWIDSLKMDGAEGEYIRSRKEIIDDFVKYYLNFEADDEW
ncbi:MAG: hypothetical protein J5999_00390 [Oscillospiraceae bacterium]|nr:hypothetical protein [Oscillospiraceae bacterium]